MNIQQTIEMADACRDGDLEKVKELVELGLDINEVLDEGKTAICWSASHGHLKLTKYLIENGANVNFQEEDEGESVLTFVMEELDNEDMVSMIELLLDNGADVELPDFLGYTPLINATSIGSAPAVEVLLKYGADPHFSLKDPDKASSAMEICENPSIKELLEQKNKT